MRRIFYALLVVAMPLWSVVAPSPARAADPSSGTCSATSVASVMGVHAPVAPSCSVTVVACPHDSAGCAFTARMSMTAATGVGASRGLLRITDPDTRAQADFYCGGPAAHCYAIQPTTFSPAGQRFLVTCSATKDNVLVNTKVSCAASFEPLEGWG